MSRREQLAAVIGMFAGAVLSLGVVLSFATNAGLWPAAIVGTVFGLAGGALGQNFIEGVVIAVICTVFVATVAVFPSMPPLFRELVVGCGVGNAAGWLAHGILT